MPTLTPGLQRCPSHDDRGPSLSVTQAADGRWLVHCFAGCAPGAVVAALGLSFVDLAPQAQPFRPRVVPPPPGPTDSAAVIAGALRLAREQARRSPPELLVLSDLIRAKRRVAYATRQWIAKWGACEASWTLVACAAELEREADDLEAGMSG